MNISVVADPVKAANVVLKESLGARLVEKLSKDLGHGEEIFRHLRILQSTSEFRIVQKVAIVK